MRQEEEEEDEDEEEEEEEEEEDRSEILVFIVRFSVCACAIYLFPARRDHVMFFQLLPDKRGFLTDMSCQVVLECWYEIFMNEWMNACFTDGAGKIVPLSRRLVALVGVVVSTKSGSLGSVFLLVPTSGIERNIIL